MGPKQVDERPDHELLRTERVNRVDHRRERVKRGRSIDWQAFADEWSPHSSPPPAALHRPRGGWQRCLTRSTPTRSSDKDTVERWSENPYPQHFSGERYFQHELPCDPSSRVRRRQRIGQAGCEWLLAPSGWACAQCRATRWPVPSLSKGRATADSQIEQSEILCGATPKIALVDRGYRGVEPAAATRLRVSHTRRLPEKSKKLPERRQVVEPMIGPTKADGLLDKNGLESALGDAVHAILCGAGHTT